MKSANLNIINENSDLLTRLDQAITYRANLKQKAQKKELAVLCECEGMDDDVIDAKMNEYVGPIYDEILETENYIDSLMSLADLEG